MDFTEERIFEVGHGKINKNSPGRKVGGKGGLHFRQEEEHVHGAGGVEEVGLCADLQSA